MTDINHYAPRSGRVIKEDNTVINTGEMIEALYNALVVNKDAGIQLTGSNMELYGKTLDDRPAANTVKPGTTFTIVDNKLNQNWISDGTDWLEV